MQLKDSLKTSEVKSYFIPGSKNRVEVLLQRGLAVLAAETRGCLNPFLSPSSGARRKGENDAHVYL